MCVCCFVFMSCGTYFNQPLTHSNAILGEGTEETSVLKSLPEAKNKIVVGVYNFRDQTGQFKTLENGSSFSTAITQGSTTILLKALEDTKWFRPIERENLSNLLNERNIIRSTRQEYRKTSNPNEPQLPPLLYAGVLLEGGIVSYDSNIVTGGLGARYFGLGSSAQYRQDRITIYLRAISTSNGEILKTIYVSKTILFQSLDASLFRYVKFKRLLEVETGITKNEPIHMAVTEAIEKAVESLVVEGIQDGLWEPKVNNEEVKSLVDSYNEEENIADDRRIYDRMFKEKRGNNVFELAAGTTYLQGDYPNPKFELMAVSGGYKRYMTPNFNFGIHFSKFNLANDEKHDYRSTYGFMTFDIEAELMLLPYDNLSPYAFVSGGVLASNYFKEVYPKVEYGLGLEYLLSEKVGIHAFGGYNMVFSDEVDGIKAGKRDDHYLRFGAGLNLYLFNKKKDKTKNKKDAPEVNTLNNMSDKELRKIRKQNKKNARKNK